MSCVDIIIWIANYITYLDFMNEMKIASVIFLLGSFLLHQMSLEMDLDFFVMFSSMASIVGNVASSSYSGCNAFQDSLAQYRRQVLGLPGLSINWGPISGAGVMDRQSNIAKLMAVGGLGFINARDGNYDFFNTLIAVLYMNLIILMGNN